MIMARHYKHSGTLASIISIQQEVMLTFNHEWRLARNPEGLNSYNHVGWIAGNNAVHPSIRLERRKAICRAIFPSSNPAGMNSGILVCVSSRRHFYRKKLP
jgi:hypothetical protein